LLQSREIMCNREAHVAKAQRIYHDDTPKRKIIEGKHYRDDDKWTIHKRDEWATVGKDMHNSGVWPTKLKWLEKNRRIKARMDNPKDRSFHHMITILEYLWEHRLFLDESTVIADRVGAGRYDHNGRKRPYVMCKSIQYEFLKDRGLDKVLLHYYLNALVKAGFLRRFHRKGRNGQTTYAIGWYLVNEHTQGHAYPFFRNTRECQEAIINFKIKGKYELCSNVKV
jgi:hypothetical protein